MQVLELNDSECDDIFSVNNEDAPGGVEVNM